VYSTDLGALCPGCQHSKNRCRCAEIKRLKPIGDGNVRVRRETKGRGGKTVTTITGLAMSVSEAEALLKELKRLCGTGGSLKDGVLEVQGDRCEAVMEELGRRGIKAKRAGG
jgi:translation initiation factor 1